MEVPLLHPVPPTPKVMGRLTAGISIKKDQTEIGQTPGLRPAPLPPHEGLRALLLTGARLCLTSGPPGKEQCHKPRGPALIRAAAGCGKGVDTVPCLNRFSLPWEHSLDI